MNSAYEKQKEIFARVRKIVENAEKDVVTKDRVFQPAVKTNRDMALEMTRFLMMDGSKINGIENIKKLSKLAEEGHSCLLTSEHKSNHDVPNLFRLFHDKYEENLEAFEKIIFIAGKKLNEETPEVKVFAEMFNRLVIVPKTEHPQTEEDKKRAFAINRASQKWMRENKNNNYIFLVFPTGTRTREWLPETRNGIKETYNYLKNFEYFCPLSIIGNTMPAKKGAKSMMEDPFVKDKVIYTFGEVLKTKDFIDEKENMVGQEKKEEIDLKQFVVDQLMELIYSQNKE